MELPPHYGLTGGCNQRLLCVQPVPPSPLQLGQAWLAVSEDGLFVLDHTMVSQTHLLVPASDRTVGACIETAP